MPPFHVAFRGNHSQAWRQRQPHVNLRGLIAQTRPHRGLTVAIGQVGPLARAPAAGRWGTGSDGNRCRSSSLVASRNRP